ncbi:hypothetical protein EST38_g3819 [Candolleomyces aberdarensis]|uniref:Uncharacterized protein n=1 Tax=Candolleomyces aberdarensis TaxID=2316362 RepID=A0A4Q2DPN2_9AGAR|nr:hypothetical protein EST38_g3819 [Candolleomyces aberdarensis]
MSSKVSTIFVVTSSEAILYLRLYAFSGRDNRLLAFLTLNFLAFTIGAWVFFVHFFRSMKYERIPVPNVVCLPTEADTRLYGALYGCYLASVSVAMITMLYIQFRKYGNLNSALMKIFYQDGVFYFMCLSAIAIANLIVNVVSGVCENTLSPVPIFTDWIARMKPEYRFLLAQPEANLHAILSTRMLMHLRKYAQREQRYGLRPKEDAWTVTGIGYSTKYDHTFRTRREGSPLRFAEDQVDTRQMGINADHEPNG